MQLTKFFKLRQAICNLDVNLIFNRINKVEEYLMKNGLPFDPENTAITQEGIYYIDPECGMATKVVLYMSDHAVQLDKPHKKETYLTGYSDHKTIENMHPYHILRCNVLAQAEAQGWKERFLITQRNSGSFYYRIVNSGKRSKKSGDQLEIYQEIEHQRLYICQNCLMKVTSIVDEVQGVTRESFPLKNFFDVDFTRSWMNHEKLAKEKGMLTDIYPKDWLEICRIRMEQVNYHCESCLINLSEPHLRGYLYVHHADHVKRQVAYVKLECLCIACLAEHPSRHHLKELPEYVRFIGKIQSANQSTSTHQSLDL